MSASQGPIHIVMTPVRNEAWVLPAFLESTSRWADYIIIADQMSTDGSREIARSCPKVILIDNKNPEFNEPERQAMLVAKAREVAAGRDTLLWGLDSDEILAANFRETEDWQKILHSVPGDVFWFKWAEICPNQKEYWISSKTYYPWLFHDDGKEPHGNYVRNMHSMRIPYPIEEKQMYYVDDFRVLHLAYLNPFRTRAKRRFYCFVDWEMNRRTPISLARSYAHFKKTDRVEALQESMLYSREKDGFDLFPLVDTTGEKSWFDDYIVERLSRHSVKELRKLPIWDEEFCKNYGQRDPRTCIDRWVHHYADRTTRMSGRKAFRAIDKILKRIYR